MSRKGDCWDNAPMESFFATSKGELIEPRDENYPIRSAARADVFQYIEGFHNRCRLHSSLGYHTRRTRKQRRSNAGHEPRDGFRESGASPAARMGAKPDQRGFRPVNCVRAATSTPGSANARIEQRRPETGSILRRGSLRQFLPTRYSSDRAPVLIRLVLPQRLPSQHQGTGESESEQHRAIGFWDRVQRPRWLVGEGRDRVRKGSGRAGAGHQAALQKRSLSGHLDPGAVRQVHNAVKVAVCLVPRQRAAGADARIVAARSFL
jgi:hypothetical protein